MPFTFLHPAAIVPLTYLPRRWVSVTGLAVGSVAPDFEYFLRMRFETDHSHTLAGLFYFDLPLGVLLAFAFHGLVRNGLVTNLPLVLRRRLWPYTTFDWVGHFRSHWPAVLLSVLLGAATHQLWDFLSHETGPLPEVLLGGDNTFHLFGKYWSKVRVLEFLSNIVGAAILLACLIGLPRTSSATVQVSRAYWGVFVVLTVLILYVRFLAVDLTWKWINHVVVSVISAMLLALCLTPLVIAHIARWTDRR